MRTENKKAVEKPRTIRCLWCPRTATNRFWREIEGTIGSTLECDQCRRLGSEFLLERDARREDKKRKLTRAVPAIEEL
jgi:hypothetical protein